MNKYIISVASAPKSFQNWFDGCGDGDEMEAESLEAAQDWLDDQCRLAGTNEDEYWNNNGPCAVEPEDDE